MAVAVASAKSGRLDGWHRANNGASRSGTNGDVGVAQPLAKKGGLSKVGFSGMSVADRMVIPFGEISVQGAISIGIPGETVNR